MAMICAREGAVIQAMIDLKPRTVRSICCPDESENTFDLAVNGKTTSFTVLYTPRV